MKTAQELIDILISYLSHYNGQYPENSMIFLPLPIVSDILEHLKGKEFSSPSEIKPFSEVAYKELCLKIHLALIEYRKESLGLK
tara:strand:+ start:258 stop:509 length:252 start_codon:yes stop_codon:yes gene_type:complete